MSITSKPFSTSRNAAVFFPRLGGSGAEGIRPVTGAVAGIVSRTDRERGVWKAPAGLEAALAGAPALAAALTDRDIGQLNPLGINCLRRIPGGPAVLWGARTLRGGDQHGDEFKYIPVRRTALFIETSLTRGLEWTVFAIGIALAFLGFRALWAVFL